MRRITTDIVTIDGLKINSGISEFSGQYRRPTPQQEWNSEAPRQAPVAPQRDAVNFSQEALVEEDSEHCEELCNNLLAAWG